jgi:hypothetical protein
MLPEQGANTVGIGPVPIPRSAVWQVNREQSVQVLEAKQQMQLSRRRRCW